MINKTRRNRVATSVEDVVVVALQALAERESQSTSELVRDIIVTYLVSRELLPDKTVAALAGVKG